MIEKLLSKVLGEDEDGKYYKLDLLERDDLLKTFIEIDVLDNDAFLKVAETLKRCGISNRIKKELYQTCSVLHKKGRYYIVMFKEMYGLDSQETEMSEDDYLRRNHIANLLVKWGLIKIINPEVMYAVVENKPISVFVLSYKDKKDWKLISKYNMGGIKRTNTKDGNRLIK